MPAPHPALVQFIRGEGFPNGFRVTMSVVASAVEHGIAPLVDAEVRTLDVDGDQHALVQLAMASLASAADNQAAIDALGSLVNAAENLDIAVAVFKGLAIGGRWYPKPELRPACDIDVFLGPEQAPRLGEFVHVLDPTSANRVVIDDMVATGRTFERSVVVGNVVVDIHSDPMNLLVPTRQADLVWRHTEATEIGDGTVVRQLDLELSIIQSLLNLFRDSFADLLHIYDIGLMLDEDPDWDVVERFAEVEGWTDLVRFSLGFVSDVLGRPSPLPREIAPARRWLIETIWPNRIRLKGAESLNRSRRRQSLVSLLIAGRHRDLATAVANRAFPPRGIVDDRFHGSRGPYPIALYRWRRAQRAENRQRRAEPWQPNQREGHAPSGLTARTGASDEAV